ncbi:MAG: hypothetical protein AAF191_01540, partial [Verrucomicrobiota bacterium]
MTTSRQSTAYHESGHAVQAYALGAEIESLSLEPDAEDLSHGSITIHWHNVAFTDVQVSRSEVRIALAGPAAEMIYDGSSHAPEFLQEWNEDRNMAK